MSCSISYPMAAGPGAVDGGNYLVSCCGQWTRPAGWDPTDRCRIYGKVYPAGVGVDSGCPFDAVEGNIWPYDTASGGDYDFNSSLLPNAAAGTTNQIKVWLVNIDSGQYSSFGPRNFVGCVSGDPGCHDPDCLNQAPERGPCACEDAIDHVAPREYRLGPDLRTIALFEATTRMMKLGGPPKFDSVELNYSISLSTPSRAVWVARGEAHHDAALRLEVKRCRGGLTATLYLIQLSERGIEPATRWQASRFNLARGGELHAIDACGRRTGGSIVVSVPEARCEDERTVV